MTDYFNASKSQLLLPDKLVSCRLIKKKLLIPNLYRQNQLRIQNYAEYDFVFVGADYEVFRAKITVAYFNIILR